MTIATITVPDEVLLATRMTREEIQLELAISLFQKEKLSFGKARELAGLDFWTVVRAISWIILRGQKRPFFPTTNHPPQTTNHPYPHQRPFPRCIISLGSRISNRARISRSSSGEM